MTQQWSTKLHVSVATVMHAEIDELWEAVFFVCPCRGCIWKIDELVDSQVELDLGCRQSETARSRQSVVVEAREGQDSSLLQAVAQ
jgi:hypothetical protein